ncbi:MAG: hypothetical protein JNJ77_05750 [Planctomycetia bacterium]|nr:hypothetical protein [Planctomycetia bacterium]
MKIAVLILGFLGALGAGLVGMKWLSDASANADTVKKLEEYERSLQQSNSKAASANMSSKLAELNKYVTASYLLLLGAVVGMACLVMLHLNRLKPKYAGVALIACSLIPGLLAPPSLVFSGQMIVAGGLAFLLRSTEPSAATAIA